MSNSSRYVKIAFKLTADEDGYPPVDWEDLWAIDLGNGQYQIDNIPFYVLGISSRDLVFADLKGERLIFKCLSTASKHSTVRVVMYSVVSTSLLRAQLKEIGCSTELSNSENFFSIDIPPQANYEEVASLLSDWESRGELDYEEAAIRHE